MNQHFELLRQIHSILQNGHDPRDPTLESLRQAKQVIEELEDEVISLQTVCDRYHETVETAIGTLRWARRTGEVQEVVEKLETLL
jgi:hypothetical protein